MTVAPQSVGAGSRASLDRVYAALDRGGFGPRLQGSHLQARCPVHDDRTPSLGVDWSTERGGMVLLRCYACGDATDGLEIAAALGLTPGDLFDERLSRDRPIRVPRRSGAKPSTRTPVNRLGPLPKRVTAGPDPEILSRWLTTRVYDYHDAQGTVVGQVVREERDTSAGREKRFKQRRPDGRGGWEPHRPDAVVLYRLPQLLEAVNAGETVYLAEGEKDADALAEAGVVATTNPQGAGNLGDELLEAFTGARVVVVLDRDGAGYRRGVDLAHRLGQVAAAVRLVLPAVEGDHVDAADHLAAGYRVEDLVALSVEVAAARAAELDAATAAGRASVALDEVQARLELAVAAGRRGAVKAASDETRYARRWAHEAVRAVERTVAAAAAAWEAGQRLDEAITAGQSVPDAAAGRAAVGAAEDALRRAQRLARQAWQAAGAPMPEQVARLLDRLTPTQAVIAAAAAVPAGDPAPPATDHGAGRGGGSGDRGKVLAFPGGDDDPDHTGGGGGGEGRQPRLVVLRPRFERVEVEPGRAELVEIKVRDGRTQLLGVLNLDARLAEFQTYESDEPHDEDLAQRGARSEQILSHYVISYTHPGTGEMITVRVEADRVRKGDWLSELALPGLAYDSSTRGKARVWDAIRAASGPAPVTTVYRATGWRQLDGHGWVYVHAGGGISADGPVPLEVQLPGALRRIDLPPPLPDAVAVRAAFDTCSGAAFLDRLVPRVGAVLAGTAYRAVLGRNPTPTVLYGVPGSYKTAAAALTMHHFGQTWDRDRTGSSMSGQGSTLNALRDELWEARDALFFGDDFAPDKSVTAAEQFLGQVARMQYNQEARDRYDGRLGVVKPGRYSRTSLLLTSEVKASSASGTERLAVVDLARGELGLDAIRGLDAAESRRGRAAFMASLLAWMARDLPAHQQRAKERCTAATLRRSEAGHEDRVAEPFGQLEAGWELVGDFLVDIGAYQPTERAVLLERVRTALDEAARASIDPDSPTSVGERVRQLLGAALRSGFMHVTAPGGREPAYPAALRYGWRRVEARGGFAGEEERASFRLEARGDNAGVATTTTHGARLHLDPVKGMQAILEMARRAGESLQVSRSVVQRELAAVGVLRVEEGLETRYTCVVPDPAGTGGKVRMWDLDEHALLDDTEPGNDPDGEPGGDPTSPGQPDPGGGGYSADGTEGTGSGPSEWEDGTVMGAPSGNPTINNLEIQQPCEVCAKPCSISLDGKVVHWMCADGTPAMNLSPAATTDPVPAAPANLAPEAPDLEMAAGETVPAATAELAGDEAVVSAGSTTPHGPRGATRAKRWLAAAVVVDTDAIHFPDGTTRPLPEVFTHAGHAAALVRELGLGCGGDATRRNDPGQVWLTPGMCALLGLPETLDADRDTRARQLEEASTGCEWITTASEEGWQVGRGRLAGWMRVWQQGTRSAFVVLMPAIDPTLGFLEDQPAPGVLARRLQLYADAAGTAYHVSAQATGLDLLEATRAGRAVKIGTVEQLRTVVEPVEPATHPTVEDELRWSRQPTGAEATRLYVHAYDRGGSYLAATSGVALGIGDPVHHDGALAFDKRKAGYWLVDVPDAADWRVPHPLDPAGRGNPGRRRWFTTPTLTAATELGYAVAPVEAWLWPTSGRLLEGWYKRLRDARARLEHAIATGDPDAPAAREMIKSTYSRTIGEFAARHRTGQPWHRPDWRHMIIATARSNVLRKVTDIGETAGEWPVAMIADAVIYLSDTACPACAWPGETASLGHGLGKYSPYGSARLEDHREHLTGRDYRGAPDLATPAAWLVEHGCDQHRPTDATDRNGSS